MMSPNHALIQGTDLVNKLVGVLLRFRKDRIAIIADIESHVSPSQSGCYFVLCGGEAAISRYLRSLIKCLSICMAPPLHPVVPPFHCVKTRL